MKSTLFGFSLTVLLGTSLSSCYKMDEYFPVKKPKHCAIKRIQFNEYFGNYNADFYYNKHGDPDSVIFGFLSTGFANYHFYYNRHKQLRELISVHPPSGFEDWHRYGYTNGQITTDTMYVWGSTEQDPEPNNYYSKKIIHLKYDAKGRIIHERWDHINPQYPPLEFSHEYDSQGNELLPNTSLSYDNYINPHQLHPIWQFLARNYSVNNPIAGSAYNGYRLPIAFDRPHTFPSLFTFAGSGRALEQCKITYECK